MEIKVNNDILISEIWLKAQDKKNLLIVIRNIFSY